MVITLNTSKITHASCVNLLTNSNYIIALDDSQPFYDCNLSPRW